MTMINLNDPVLLESQKNFGTEKTLSAFRDARTEEEAKYRLMKALFGTDANGNVLVPDSAAAPKEYTATREWPYRESDLSVPFSTKVLADIGIYPTRDKSGAVTKTAQEKFVERYPKERKDFEKELSRKPYAGKTFADPILRNIFRTSVKDVAEQKTDSLRREAMEGDDLYGKYASIAGSLFLPSVKQAGIEGRDPRAGDWAKDVVRNVSFAIPGGAYARPARYLGSKLPLLSGGKVGKVADLAYRGIGEAGAPVVGELGRYAADRAEGDSTSISPENIAMGTLTNLGVAQGLYMAGAKAAPVITGQLGRGGSGAVLRESINGAKAATELVSDAKAAVSNAKKFNSDKAFGAWLAGDAKTIDQPALKEAKAIVSFSEDVKKMSPNIKTSATTADGFAKDFLEQNGVTGEKLESYMQLLKDYPQLATIIPAKGKGGVRAKRILNEAMSSPMKAWGVNRYGNDKDADIVSTRLGLGTTLTGDLKTRQEERQLADRRRAENANLRSVDTLNGEPLTETDRKYIEGIIQNPGMLKFSNDTGFKLWLVTRGNDLLRGTSYFRPSWDVEVK